MRAVRRVAKSYLHRLGLRHDIGLTRTAALCSEIERLSISDSGVEDDLSWVEVDSCGRFFGCTPAGVPSLYSHLSRKLRARLKEPCAQLAIDLVYRYVYPHLDATLPPPYDSDVREAFHLQHRDTLQDCSFDNGRVKAEIVSRFRLSKGQTIIDAGAFIGFGTMKACRIIGPQGRVISIEAHPLNQRIFCRNMSENNIANAVLIRCACWKTVEDLQFNCDGNQANSVCDGIVGNSKGTMAVPATTIDQVAIDQRLCSMHIVSLTLNGAEFAALEGMTQSLATFRPSITMAGWFEVNGGMAHVQAAKLLRGYGYESLVGPARRLYAWHPEGSRKGSVECL